MIDPMSSGWQEKKNAKVNEQKFLPDNFMEMISFKMMSYLMNYMKLVY